MNSTAQSGVGHGAALAFAVLLMWALNAAFGMTFPPEVSSAFQYVVGIALTIICKRTGICDLDGDGKADVGAGQ